MTDYDAMVRSLSATAPRRTAAASCPPRAIGMAVWAVALAIGVICLAVYLASPSPVPHHAAPARCTVSAPCYTGRQAGKLIGAYVLVRTARGIVRMPLRAARAYYRARMFTGPLYWNLPSGGGG